MKLLGECLVLVAVRPVVTRLKVHISFPNFVIGCRMFTVLSAIQSSEGRCPSAGIPKAASIALNTSRAGTGGTGGCSHLSRPHERPRYNMRMSLPYPDTFSRMPIALKAA